MGSCLAQCVSLMWFAHFKFDYDNHDKKYEAFDTKTLFGPLQVLAEG